jgi:enoyl-CoA hydratase
LQSSFQTLLYEKEGHIAHLTLNRPRVHNAINIQMRDDLWVVLPAIRDDPDVLVVIIKGAGERAFTAGADLSEFGTAPSQAIAKQVRWERDTWGLFQHMDKIMIAAIQGYCVGSGIEMALLCDLRIASEEARFSLPEAGLGLIPAAGGTQTVPRQIGQDKALEMLYTGEFIDAQEAYRIGMVHEIVSRDELYSRADELAQHLLAMPPWALRLTKEAVNRGLDISLPEGIELEAKLAEFAETSTS